MNVALVVLDFKNKTAHRYVNRMRTHRSKLPDGFCAQDKEQIESYRKWPMSFEEPQNPKTA